MKVADRAGQWTVRSLVNCPSMGKEIDREKEKDIYVNKQPVYGR